MRTFKINIYTYKWVCWLFQNAILNSCNTNPSKPKWCESNKVEKTRRRQWFIALFFLGGDNASLAYSSWVETMVHCPILPGEKRKKGEGYRALFDPSYCPNTAICRTYQLFTDSIMKVTTFFVYSYLYNKLLSLRFLSWMKIVTFPEEIEYSMVSAIIAIFTQHKIPKKAF